MFAFLSSIINKELDISHSTHYSQERGEGEWHRCAAGMPWFCSNTGFKLLSAQEGDVCDITEIRGLQ